MFDDENYSAADEILNQIEDDQNEEITQDGETLNWAVQRIEEANLFKYLLSTPIFAQNSADPAIVASVNSKISKFAMNELKELLGGKKEEKLTQAPASQFNEDEVLALKTIASKIIEKTGTSKAIPEDRTPTINSIDVNNRQIATNKIAANQPTPKTNNPIPKQAVKVKQASTLTKSTKNMTPEEKKRHDLAEKSAKRKAQAPPVQPIAQPVNQTWAQAHSQGTQKGLVGGISLASLVGVEMATPITANLSKSGDGAIEFDPDNQ